MKKLLVVLMAACMSLGVWGEAARAAEYPHPKWLRVKDYFGSGIFVTVSTRRPQKLQVKLHHSSPDAKTAVMELRHAGSDRTFVAHIGVSADGLITITPEFPGG